MITLLLSFLTLSLENSGDLFYGFYPSSDSLHNSDVSMWTRLNLVSTKKKTQFFIQYSTYLEMARQKGKVILDPAFSNFSIILGFQYFRKFYFSLYIDHYCRHIIDKELEEGKAVFNAVNFIFSNERDPAHRFSKKIYFRLAYLFYPQGIFVDYLNSKPYYRHRFLLDAGKNINSFTQLTIKTEYTLSNHDPRKKYYQVRPGIFLFKKIENRTLYIFLHYYLTSNTPLRCPNHLFCIGAGYSF